MRSVSDTGATAPISALTYAFIFVSNPGHENDDFGRRIIGNSKPSASVVKQLDNGIEPGPACSKL